MRTSLTSRSPGARELGSELGQLLQSECQEMQGERLPPAYHRVKERKTMGYLILFSVLAILALYVAIIIGCLTQPEW
jgi:hypothetical protein